MPDANADTVVCSFRYSSRVFAKIPVASSSSVVFQEFSNEERCKAAKASLEGSLKEAGAKLRSGLEDLKSIGKADPAQIIIAFNVECLPK